MQWLIDCPTEAEKAAEIIRLAGGAVIGRTRLQKLAYLLEITGLGQGFSFEYRHYGPYSEELTRATSIGAITGVLSEEERPASWGGSYSIFTTPTSRESDSPAAQALIKLAVHANPIDLELAATAAFLAHEGHPEPWEETSRRKLEKASRIGSARDLYAQLGRISFPKNLPTI